MISRIAQGALVAGTTLAAVGGGVAAYRIIGDRTPPYVDLPGPDSIEDAIGNLPFFLPTMVTGLAAAALLPSKHAGIAAAGAAATLVTGALGGATMVTLTIGRDRHFSS